MSMNSIERDQIPVVLSRGFETLENITSLLGERSKLKTVIKDSIQRQERLNEMNRKILE